MKCSSVDSDFPAASSLMYFYSELFEIEVASMFTPITHMCSSIKSKSRIISLFTELKLDTDHLC